MRRSSRLLIAVVALWSVAAPVRASGAAGDRPWLIPPVDAPVARAFEPPATRWGPGHRGLDYDLSSGQDVRAAGDGSVAFAGTVAGTVAITIEHQGDLKTTYSRLSEVFVKPGEVVGQGQSIGRVGNSHVGAEGGLHFGVKLHDQYVDPQLYLGPLEVGEAIHLIPTSGDHPSSQVGAEVNAQVEGTTVRCTLMGQAIREGQAGAPPNDNVAVLVGGITSEYPGSGEPEVFAVGEALGYPPERVVRFSYSGKETYRRQDTFVDLRLSAGRLAALVRRVGQTWPGHDVDLIAHSQGGLVAREYLKGYASSWDPHAPRVDHLVTFASPHQGAPLVGEIDEVEARTITGDHAMDVLSRFARSNGYVPDPHGASTQQMEPGSEFLTNLAEEDVLYGTRVLTLAMPYDFIVPANHARYPGQLNRVVPGPLGFHHRMVVESPVARGLARSFLRDAAEPCHSRYDATGPAAGRAISDASRTLDSLYWALDGSAVVSAGRAISRLLPLSAASGAVKVLSDNPAVRLSRGLAELSGRMGAPVRLFPTGPDP